MNEMTVTEEFTSTSLSSVLNAESLARARAFSEELPPERVETPVGKAPSKDKHDIVSRVAYLIGVDVKYFTFLFDHDIYDWLETEPEARIVRNLCALRTSLERNYNAIRIAMDSDIRNLNTLPDLVPQEPLRRLSEDRVTVVKANRRLDDYIVDIHNLLSSHVHNCKDLFPEWVKWPYIRSLFIIPGGGTTEGNRAAVQRYYSQKDYYPYQAYINWTPQPDEGNILYNDNKFLTILYKRNHDQFTDISKTTRAGEAAITDLGEFFKAARRTVMAVDCENADPCKVIGTLREIERLGLLGKISKILLVDDRNTSSQWEALRKNTKLPVEYTMTHRIKKEKSAVDVALTIKFCREIAGGSEPVDSAVIVSSDCDFWPLIEMNPEIRFLVLLEYESCGQDYYQELQAHDVAFYYIDEFYTVGSNELKNEVVLDTIVKEIEEHCFPQLNMNAIVARALSKVDIKMSATEVKEFYERYLSSMRIVFEADGAPVLEGLSRSEG